MVSLCISSLHDLSSRWPFPQMHVYVWTYHSLHCNTSPSGVYNNEGLCQLICIHWLLLVNIAMRNSKDRQTLKLTSVAFSSGLEFNVSNLDNRVLFNSEIFTSACSRVFCFSTGSQWLTSASILTWPSGKLPFECQKIAKNLNNFFKNKKLPKIVIFSKKLPLAI